MMPPPEGPLPVRRRECRIAAVVVLYHPGDDLLENIASYSSQVDVLFAVDNSEDGTSGVVDGLGSIGNVIYRANGENLGVARALNIGAELAREHGCDYLLTMDQDSRAAPGMVDELFACLGSIPAPDIGIVAPFLSTKPGQAPPGTVCCEDVPTAMTSGSLLSLSAFRTVGPFMDELFVDFVDIEYCLRLRRRGFRVVRANRAVLAHHVGQVQKFSLFSRNLYLTSHSPLRKYYKTRNRFFVADRYKGIFPAFRRADLLRFWLETLRLLFFEDNKREKLVMMGKGYRDYRRGLLGRFDAGGGGAQT
jgi:rhamnosyltransferase